MNLTMLLEMAASAFSERVALTSDERALRYADLFAAAGGGADAIAASGAGHVAYLDVNGPALAAGLFASTWSGRPFAPLSYRVTGRELRERLDALAPVYLIADAERARDLAGHPGVTSVSAEAFMAHAAPDAPRASDWPMDGDAIAVLLFTSGTSGPPKAAVLRQRHLMAYILDAVEFGAAGEDEATLMSVPPYHVAAVAAILSSVYAGRRIVQLPGFDAKDWIALARRERVSHAFVVPTMLARIADALASEGPDPLPDLRALAYGGGPMPRRVVEEALRRLPDTAFTNAYGLTETSSTIAVLTPDDHRDAAASDDPAVRQRLASVGRPLPGVEIRVRDADGRPCPPGTSGEICVRGPQVAGEYLGLGARLDADGWFATRDGGFLDADGFLFVEGRLDDVIVRGGENLSPGEIEEVLRAHPGVADCAVVGVPDDQWGEAVAAVVVPRDGARVDPEALRAWVRERLRSSRAPERIETRPALPYNETGKLLRRTVRDELLRGT